MAESWKFQANRQHMITKIMNSLRQVLSPNNCRSVQTIAQRIENEAFQMSGGYNEYTHNITLGAYELRKQMKVAVAEGPLNLMAAIPNQCFGGDTLNEPQNRISENLWEIPSQETPQSQCCHPQQQVLSMGRRPDIQSSMPLGEESQMIFTASTKSRCDINRSGHQRVSYIADQATVPYAALQQDLHGREAMNFPSPSTTLSSLPSQHASPMLYSQQFQNSSQGFDQAGATSLAVDAGIQIRQSRAADPVMERLTKQIQDLRILEVKLEELIKSQKNGMTNIEIPQTIASMFEQCNIFCKKFEIIKQQKFDSNRPVPNSVLHLQNSVSSFIAQVRQKMAENIRQHRVKAEQQQNPQVHLIKGIQQHRRTLPMLVKQPEKETKMYEQQKHTEKVHSMLLSEQLSKMKDSQYLQPITSSHLPKKRSGLDSPEEMQLKEANGPPQAEGNTKEVYNPDTKRRKYRSTGDYQSHLSQGTLQPQNDEQLSQTEANPSEECRNPNRDHQNFQASNYQQSYHAHDFSLLSQTTSLSNEQKSIATCKIEASGESEGEIGADERPIDRLIRVIANTKPDAFQEAVIEMANAIYDADRIPCGRTRGNAFRDPYIPTGYRYDHFIMDHIAATKQENNSSRINGTKNR